MIVLKSFRIFFHEILLLFLKRARLSSFHMVIVDYLTWRNLLLISLFILWILVILTRLAIELIGVFAEVLFFSNVICWTCYHFFQISSFCSNNTTLLLIVKCVDCTCWNIFLFVSNYVSQIIYFLIAFADQSLLDENGIYLFGFVLGSWSR